MDLFAQAIARHNAGELAEAERLYRAVLAADPAHDGAWGNLGLVLARLKRDGAEEALRRAAELDPRKGRHHYNLGSHYVRLGKAEEAARSYELARELDPKLPNVDFLLGEARLAAGDLAGGWPLYDARPNRAKTNARQLDFPEWSGEPLAGRSLLIWVEQGFGDQILAARYLRRLDAAKVTWVCQPPLVRLFRNLPANIVRLEDPITLERHDLWCLPMSMPRWVGGPLWDGPYLSGEGPRVGRFGVVWRGNAAPDPNRSLDDTSARRLLELPGAVSLDPEDTGAKDFQDTADLIAGLDFVVSIDTSAAHLAGAMGKPVWLLLQRFTLDWRWTLPWYSGVKIYRQQTQGDWSAVIDEVVASLTATPPADILRP